MNSNWLNRKPGEGFSLWKIQLTLSLRRTPPRGVLLGILGGGVPPGSPNPDPISDQKMSFFTPVFRPGFYLD